MTINFDDDAKSGFDKIGAKEPYDGLEAHFWLINNT